MGKRTLFTIAGRESESRRILFIMKYVYLFGPSIARLDVSIRKGKNDKEERFVAVLEILPVVSPITAVRASIIADKKKREK